VKAGLRETFRSARRLVGGTFLGVLRTCRNAGPAFRQHHIIQLLQYVTIGIEVAGEGLILLLQFSFAPEKNYKPLRRYNEE
jgi:hypothetical protein